MMIIIDEPKENIHVTQDEYNYYISEYIKAYQFYCGVPPTFETFVSQRKKES